MAIILTTLLPGTAMSLAWPAEYLVLGGWVALGALVYRLAPSAVPEARVGEALFGRR